jgi:hypothetical protein
MNTAFGVRNGADVSVMSPEEEALMNDAEMKEAAEAAFSNTKQT